MEDKPDIKKMALGLGIGVIILGVVIYAGYAYSQKKGGKLTLPAGPNYLGNKGMGQLANPPTAPLRFTANADTPWVTFKGKVYSYSLSHPETLSLSSFPNDPSDSVAIIWGNINPQSNLLLNIESIKDRNPEYVGKPEEFVRNWWKAFSGLKGVVSVDKLTNASGLKGYKAIYVNTVDQSPNVDIFFEIPNNQDLMIHMANGILDPLIFNRIIDSVKYSPPTPTKTE